MNTIPSDINGTIHDLYNEVSKVIESEVRPFVERDGGRITLKSVEGGIVYVELSGACDGCSAADFTIRAGVERILRRRIPSVTSAKLWK